MLLVCRTDLWTVFLSGHQGEHLLHNIQFIIMTQGAYIWKTSAQDSEQKTDTAEMTAHDLSSVIHLSSLTLCLEISLEIMYEVILHSYNCSSMKTHLSI